MAILNESDCFSSMMAQIAKDQEMTTLSKIKLKSSIIKMNALGNIQTLK